MRSLHHIELMIRLSPVCCDLSEGSNARLDLEVWASGLDRVWLQAQALYEEIFPSTTIELVGRWETEYAILRTDRSLPLRRAAVLAHHRFLPDLTPATIEGLLETLLVLDVTITEPFSFRCDDPDSLCDTWSDSLDAYTFFVSLDEEAAREAGHTRAEVLYFVGLVKPAHTLGIIVADDFLADDEWSLCDFDRLGA